MLFIIRFRSAHGILSYAVFPIAWGHILIETKDGIAAGLGSNQRRRLFQSVEPRWANSRYSMHIPLAPLGLGCDAEQLLPLPSAAVELPHEVAAPS